MSNLPKLGETLARLSGYRSAREIGELSDVSNTYVSRILKGHRPSFDVLVKIADGLGLSQEERAELYTAAKYAVPLAPLHRNPRQELQTAIEEFKKRHGLEKYLLGDLLDVVGLDLYDPRGFTPKQIQQALATLERHVREGTLDHAIRTAPPVEKVWIIGDDVVVSNRPPQKEDLTYEPVMEEIDLAGYPGAENLDPSDLRALNEIVRAFIESKRQSKG